MADVWKYTILALDIAGYFFAFLLIPRIILERRHPSRAKIATVGPVASSLSHRLRPEELPSVLSTLCGRVLVAAGTPPPTEGNRVTFLPGGDEAYDAVLSLIGSARDHLHAQFFILDVDPVGRRFIQALAARAREGIRVRLLLDAVGSWRALRRTVRPLRDAGGEVAAFLPAFPLHRRWSAHLRNHRKLLIADGRKAFTGGMNIGKKYMGPKTAKEQWRDVAAVIEGPALPDLQALFLDDWAFSTEETLPAGVFFPAPVRFIAGGEVLFRRDDGGGGPDLPLPGDEPAHQVAGRRRRRRGDRIPQRRHAQLLPELRARGVPLRPSADRGDGGGVPRRPREVGTGRPGAVRPPVQVPATPRRHLPDLLPPLLIRALLPQARAARAEERREKGGALLRQDARGHEGAVVEARVGSDAVERGNGARLRGRRRPRPPGLRRRRPPFPLPGARRASTPPSAVPGVPGSPRSGGGY